MPRTSDRIFCKAVLLHQAKAKKLEGCGDEECLLNDTFLQVEDMLKELGPKRNPDKSHRLIPAAKMVGEGELLIHLMHATLHALVLRGVERSPQFQVLLQDSRGKRHL